MLCGVVAKYSVVLDPCVNEEPPTLLDIRYRLMEIHFVFEFLVAEAPKFLPCVHEFVYIEIVFQVPPGVNGEPRAIILEQCLGIIVLEIIIDKLCSGEDISVYARLDSNRCDISQLPGFNKLYRFNSTGVVFTSCFRPHLSIDTKRVRVGGSCVSCYVLLPVNYVDKCVPLEVVPVLLDKIQRRGCVVAIG